MRIKLTIEYDGGRFFGWQKQQGHISVQESIETAISKVFDNLEMIELYGAGRTDTGVHAINQVAHFDIVNEYLIRTWERNIEKLPIAINSYLLDSGATVIYSEIVPSDFHARFSALMRHYKYVIYNRKIKSVFYDRRAWHIAKELDVVSMNDAAQLLIGTHNLNSFRSVHCGAKNPVRTISTAKVYRNCDLVVMEISAKSFLHNQVRIIIGTLVKIGEGKYPAEYIDYLLNAQDRTLAGPTAPPYGLYLTKVDFNLCMKEMNS